MAPEKLDRLGTNALLYAFTKALHRAVGGSAAAVMRQAGPDMLSELTTLGISGIDSTDINVIQEKIGNLFLDLGFCESILFDKTDDLLSVHVKGCSFWELTQSLKEEGIPPFACPFAGVMVAIAEKNLGYRARIKQVVPEGERASLIEIQLSN